jgi:hypothetical protein
VVDDETNADTPTVPLSARKQKRAKEASVPPRYEMKDVLGEGGMGAVYLAHDKVLGRDVAVKLLWKDMPGMDKTVQRERFVREAQAAARLAHPNIVAVYDVDPDGGWIVMELVKGESLRTIGDRAAHVPELSRRPHAGLSAVERRSQTPARGLAGRAEPPGGRRGSFGQVTETSARTVACGSGRAADAEQIERAAPRQVEPRLPDRLPDDVGETAVIA